MEGEMDELSVKYSEALLEHEATRRVLGQASEELSREALVRAAAERQAQDLRQRLDDTLAEKEADDAHMKDLVRKYTNLEDALGESCRETLFILVLLCFCCCFFLYFCPIFLFLFIYSFIYCVYVRKYTNLEVLQGSFFFF
ncbi:hypothetical protein E2C01_098820 [Portunus trituberculatus]|uniref:Uncharacterized protein n=1 Tax=Portunus trituberculatus TaxID=210409 RepID=A0A5B7KF41_PORTR|nr:hypothetical protein [Portunus trituberculatus]